MTTPLTEKDAERHLAAHALTAAHPGFVGLSVDLPPATPGPAGRSRLRHGFLIVEAGRVVISGPPSPGLEVAVDRMAEDIELAATLIGRAATARGAGVRVHLEAGTDDHRPTGMRRRWAVAQAVAPVLAAAFANAPATDGPRDGWRSAPRRPDAPGFGSGPRSAWTEAKPNPRPAQARLEPDPRPAQAGLGPDPRTAWAREVLDAPVDFSPAAIGQWIRRPPTSFRQWLRPGQEHPPTVADLDRHERAYRPPVAARGVLEIDVTDRLSGLGWQVAAAVISTLVEDPRAAVEALVATAELRNTPYLWERAARDALTDPDLAAAARSLFLAAYGALARRGAPRPLRDAVAAYAEHFVLCGRCPADDQRPTDNLRTAEIRENRS